MNKHKDGKHINTVMDVYMGYSFDVKHNDWRAVLRFLHATEHCIMQDRHAAAEGVKIIKEKA